MRAQGGQAGIVQRRMQLQGAIARLHQAVIGVRRQGLRKRARQHVGKHGDGGTTVRRRQGWQEQHIVAAPFDAIDGARGAAARAWRCARDQDVVQAVAHDGLRDAREVRNHGHEAARFTVFRIEPLRFDVHVFLVQMQHAVFAAAGKETLGGLVDFMHGAKRLHDQRAVLRFQHFGHGDDFFRRQRQAAIDDAQGQLAQHLGRRDDDGWPVLRQPRAQRIERFEQIVKGKGQPRRTHGRVQIAVRAQEQRDSFAGKQAIGQRLGQHHARPLGFFAGADGKHGAPRRSARRQSHRDVAHGWREVAAMLGRHGRVHRLRQSHPFRVHGVEMLEHQRLVHRRPLRQRQLAVWGKVAAARAQHINETGQLLLLVGVELSAVRKAQPARTPVRQQQPDDTLHGRPATAM
ncbi:hypothetical protein D3C72_1231340 [compost metagenome]